MLVLVVDDDRVSSLIAEHILLGGGHEVVCASSAAEAHRIITDDEVTPIGAIVCDYQMPEATGLDLLQQLTGEMGVDAHPPFVLLTGVSEQGDLDRTQAKGLAGFLTKPVRSAELLRIIDELATSPTCS